jgi:hypothetical protein
VRVDELKGYYAKRFVTARRFGSRVSPPAMPGLLEPVPADTGFPQVEEPETIHPDQISVHKLDPESDAPLAHGGEPVCAVGRSSHDRRRTGILKAKRGAASFGGPSSLLKGLSPISHGFFGRRPPQSVAGGASSPESGRWTVSRFQADW